MSELSEKGHLEANELLNSFRERMKKIADEVMGELYVNVMPYIETDSWLNYRETLRCELMNKYRTVETCTSEEYWAKSVREAIYKQFNAELKQGIIRDLEEQIEELKADLNRRDWR